MASPVAPRMDDESPEDDGRMTILEHLQELRRRLRNAALVLAAATLAAGFFAWDFFQFLTRPVARAMAQLHQPAKAFKTNPAEGFWVQLELALVLGIAVALPLILWELWKFVAPGLYRRERKLTLAFTAGTVLCFLGGAVFGYLLLAPAAHVFLLGSGVQPAPPEGGLEVSNMLTLSAVVSFQITMLLGAGAAFELPVVLGILGWLGIVSARSLWRFNRYALVLAAVAGAVLTPGSDVYSQLLLAGPLYVLYNLSIGLVWLIQRRPAVPEESPLLLLLAASLTLRRPRARPV
jgi:sec-independent protein translocase protein TatC